MGSTLLLRSATTRMVGAVVMGVGLIGVATLLASGRLSSLTTYGAALGIFSLIGWTVLWRPYVEVSDGFVVMRNVMRTVTVTWPAIQEVEGRYGLRLTTAYGRFSAWAAPAPTGRERLRQGESEAAEAVRARLAELEPYLVDARLERDSPLVRWHWPELGAAAALLAAAVVGALGR